MSPVQPSPALLNAQLTATVVELEEKLEEATRLNTRARTLEHENALLVDRVAELEGTVSDLRAHLERLLQGSGAVAKIAPGQHVLFEDVTASIEALAAPEDSEPEAEAAELAPEDAEVPDGEAADDKQPKASNRPRDRRKIDESNLRREVVRVELPTAERRCPVTGVELEEVGVKVSTELGYKSAELVLIERHQVVYGPPPEVAAERQIEPLVTPAPPRAVAGVDADESLLAWLLHQKYVLHLPLYRQEVAFAQLGVRLSRKTLCDWVMKSALALQPVAREIEQAIRAGPVLQIDDTPIKVKRAGPNGERLKLRQSYLWALCSPTVTGLAFRYTKGRGAEDVASILPPEDSGQGPQVLVGDGYQANQAGARKAGLEVGFAGCWAHLLRKFRDALPEAPKSMGLFMQDISKLYTVEAQAKAEGLDPKGRLELRRRESLPVALQLLRLTSGWREHYSLGGAVSKAMTYARNQRHELLAFLRDGRVPIDNNACERGIRPVAIGRKNWQFAGSEDGARAAATVYTLVESARASKVDPLAYIEALLRKLGPGPEAAGLTPWEMAGELPAYRPRIERG